MGLGCEPYDGPAVRAPSVQDTTARQAHVCMAYHRTDAAETLNVGTAVLYNLTWQ